MSYQNLTLGHCYSVGERTVNSYHCPRCIRYLGRVTIDHGRVDDEIEEWNYCPFCGYPIREEDYGQI